jgi:hypothetical protein
MDLTDTQRETLINWVKEGFSIADVQNRLREDFSISMTYMDVRFLVDDLNIPLDEPEAESEEFSDAADTATPEETADTEEAIAASDPPVEEPELVGGSVTVDVDAVSPPGALVSGTVIFSDGKQMSWQLSASGQLGLVPGDDPEYRPQPEDVEQFQAQLQKVLQEKGY